MTSVVNLIRRAIGPLTDSAGFFMCARYRQSIEATKKKKKREYNNK